MNAYIRDSCFGERIVPMKIIRPYGESRTEPDNDGLRRVFRDRTQARAWHEIPEYASEHDELVIAQWISLMDKIARKPPPDRPASEEQRSFRDRLGQAAWQVLCENNRISEDGQRALKALWEFKTHPYGENINGRGKAEGRWYPRFAGKCGTDNTDVIAIANAMDRNLHEAEKRINGDRPDKRVGLIDSRAARHHLFERCF